MATVGIAFGRVMQGVAPVASAVPSSTDVITSSSSSQASTAAAAKDDVCTITSSGGDVWVAFGGTPVASAGTSHLIVSGQTRDFGNLPAGHKVAVIDA